MQVMQGVEAIHCKVFRPNMEDEDVLLEAPLTMSRLKDLLKQTVRLRVSCCREESF